MRPSCSACRTPLRPSLQPQAPWLQVPPVDESRRRPPSVCAGTPHTCDLVAADVCECLLLPRRTFQELLRRFPSLAASLKAEAEAQQARRSARMHYPCTVHCALRTVSASRAHLPVDCACPARQAWLARRDEATVANIVANRKIVHVAEGHTARRPSLQRTATVSPSSLRRGSAGAPRRSWTGLGGCSMVRGPAGPRLRRSSTALGGSFGSGDGRDVYPPRQAAARRRLDTQLWWAATRRRLERAAAAARARAQHAAPWRLLMFGLVLFHLCGGPYRSSLPRAPVTNGDGATGGLAATLLYSRGLRPRVGLHLLARSPPRAQV